MIKRRNYVRIKYSLSKIEGIIVESEPVIELKEKNKVEKIVMECMLQNNG